MGNQAALNIHRWPPLWYLKDFELYQRMESDQKRNDRTKPLKRSRYESNSRNTSPDVFALLAKQGKVQQAEKGEDPPSFRRKKNALNVNCSQSKLTTTAKVGNPRCTVCK